MALTANEVASLKHAPEVEGVLPVFHERWSARAFADRDVSTADLKKVFDAARWAPSSYNEQPWRFLVGLRGTETHDKIASALISFNKAWAPKAPVLILGMARTHFSHNNTPNGYGLYDLGAATAYLVLEAAALGLTTHQMAGFDHDAARKALAIPEEFALGSVTALGYQGEPSLLGDEKLIGMETTPRARKALSEIVFSAWEQPAKLG